MASQNNSSELNQSAYVFNYSLEAKNPELSNPSESSTAPLVNNSSYDQELDVFPSKVPKVTANVKKNQKLVKESSPKRRLLLPLSIT